MKKSVILVFLFLFSFAAQAIVKQTPYFKSDSQSKYQFEMTANMCRHYFAAPPRDYVTTIICETKLVDMPSGKIKIKAFRAYQESGNNTEFDLSTGIFKITIYDYEGATPEGIDEIIGWYLEDINREPTQILIERDEFWDAP